MTMRLMKLPADFLPLTEVLTESFQYPENPDWSVQTDEKEQLVAAMKNFRRIWPLIRLIQALSPPLRDLLRGYVWEENGRAVGVTITQRRGSTAVWIIGTVGVLPGYRRRGIARELVAATLDLIREHGGTKAILAVIDGNLPAYALYEKLGFEEFGGSVEFHFTPQSAPPDPVLPAGYSQSPLTQFDWRPRYELEKRTSPERVLKYEPVEVGRFRQPFMMRALLPLIQFAQGVRDKDLVICTAPDGEVVARGGYTIPTRGKGVNSLRARLDAAHPELAPYLMGHLLHKAMVSSPGRRVEFSAPRWMEALVAAAEQAGFKRRYEYSRMGLVL